MNTLRVTLDGLRKIAINVIGKAGYNREQKWSLTEFDSSTNKTTGKEAYFEMLGLATNMILQAAFIPQKIMQLPFMPFTLQTMGYHLERAPQYIDEILRNEKQSETSRENNFLSLMLQASEEKLDSEAKYPLTKEEINGNLFVFTTAGFETTANTMGFAVIFLALYPEWQSWIQEEIHNLGTSDLSSEYEKVFPKCRRILALMV